MAETNTGTVRPRLIRNRSVILRNSGLSCFSAEMVRGSRVMPQIGQFPGSLRTICECIGQTYSVRADNGVVVTGSRAIPHLGQFPGADCRTSGCIGQVNSPAPGLRSKPAAIIRLLLLFAHHVPHHVHPVGLGFNLGLQLVEQRTVFSQLRFAGVRVFLGLDHG